jgi:hypothetical protein
MRPINTKHLLNTGLLGGISSAIVEMIPILMIQNLLRQLGVIPVEKAGTQAEERPSDGARNPRHERLFQVGFATFRGLLGPDLRQTPFPAGN